MKHILPASQLLTQPMKTKHRAISFMNNIFLNIGRFYLGSILFQLPDGINYLKITIKKNAET